MDVRLVKLKEALEGLDGCEIPYNIIVNHITPMRDWIKEYDAEIKREEAAEDSRVAFIIGWIARMSTIHGGTVIDRESGVTYDWGQAICRETLGVNWDELVGESPSEEDVERAKTWEAGDVPAWAKTER